MQDQYQLSTGVFAEFRSQLIELHDAFRDLDEDSSGLLDVEEVMCLLFYMGCHRRKPGTVSIEEVVKQLLEQFGTQDVDFPMFIRIVCHLRKLDRDSLSEEVETLFEVYDADRSGALDMKEVCRVLHDLGVSPKTPKDQDSISQLIEEVDTDGSGHLGFEEVLTLIQRIAEKLWHTHRLEENTRVADLGFPRHEINVLRHVFELLDADKNSFISLNEVERAVKLIGWCVSRENIQGLFADIGVEASGLLNFVEFASLLRRLLDNPTLSKAGSSMISGESGRAAMEPGCEFSSAHDATTIASVALPDSHCSRQLS
jgi:Ca2+-binding EF-hand superfamily protein